MDGPASPSRISALGSMYPLGQRSARPLINVDFPLCGSPRMTTGQMGVDRAVSTEVRICDHKSSVVDALVSALPERRSAGFPGVCTGPML